MNLLETLLNAQGGGAVRQLASQFGLEEGQAQSAISALLPALTGGVQNNLSGGGLEGLLGALGSGAHQKYLDDPSTLGQEETVSDGNAILGHLLGSKDASRAVAAQAAEQTGIGSGVLKQMLPVVAGMVMGGLSKHTQAAGGESSGVMGMLGSLLDTNQDGSVADDILGMAQKFFQK